MKDNKSKKNYSRLNAIVAFCVIWAGLAFTAYVKDHDEYNAAERRALAPKPELTWENFLSGNYMKEFETYSTEQFPLRDGFRELKANGAFYIFNKKDNNGIYIHDGYALKLESKLNENSVNKAADKLTWLYDNVIKDKTDKVYMSVIPDKNYFAAQQNGYPAMDYDKMVSIMKDKMDYATYINIFDTLELSDYYKTDTHWRQEEIVNTANTILNGMGAEKFPQKYEIKTSEEPFYGVYYGQSALPLPAEEIHYISTPGLDTMNVTIPDGTTKPPKYVGYIDKKKEVSKDPMRDLYEVFSYGAMQSMVIMENPESTSDKELIVFRDSFGSSIAPLFTESYKKVTLLDTRSMNPDIISTMLKAYGVEITENTDVLFMYSTLILNESSMLQEPGAFTIKK